MWNEGKWHHRECFWMCVRAWRQSLAFYVPTWQIDEMLFREKLPNGEKIPLWVSFHPVAQIAAQTVAMLNEHRVRRRPCKIGRVWVLFIHLYIYINVIHHVVLCIHPQRIALRARVRISLRQQQRTTRVEVAARMSCLHLSSKRPKFIPHPHNLLLLYMYASQCAQFPVFWLCFCFF